MKGKPVEVERNDWPSYPTAEVFIEGLNFKSLLIPNGGLSAKGGYQP